ncbi:hypothetical protein [Rheinheimera sp.]|uniref:hypothetical protein n=1 Tax=Rheinheimera sp. TaxID=1869214 RepID=UPI003AF8C5A9
MNNNRQTQLLWLLTLAMGLLPLGWQWLHGGIEAHHLLADPNLPTVSNAWGALIFPVLGLLASRRLTVINLFSFWRNFALAGFYAAAVAGSFLAGAEQITQPLFIAVFVMALVLPLHRAEIVLGYVLVMSLAFGAVLPLLMSLPAMVLACVATWLREVWTRRFKGTQSTNAI